MGKLIDELAKLPGIGPRTAERLASHLLRVGREDAMSLAYAIRDLKRDLRPCPDCLNWCEAERCPICSDDERNARSLCVVEESRDVAALESAGVHDGVYHVLGGRIAPMEGQTEGDLSLNALVQRVERLLAADPEAPVEVVLATNPNLEGDGTAVRIAELLSQRGERCQVSRIARGMPTGSSIEYVHREVLADAYLERRPLGRVAADRIPAAQDLAAQDLAAQDLAAQDSAAQDSADRVPAAGESQGAADGEAREASEA